MHARRLVDHELPVDARLSVRVGPPTNDPAGRRLVQLLCDGDEEALLQELGRSGMTVIMAI